MAFTLCSSTQIYIESIPQNYLLTDHIEISLEDRHWAGRQHAPPLLTNKSSCSQRCVSQQRLEEAYAFHGSKIKHSSHVMYILFLLYWLYFQNCSRVVEIHGLTGCLDFKWLMWTLLYHDFAWVQLPVLLADLACTWSLGICLRGDGWRVVCRLWLWKLKEWRSFMNWWPTCSLPGVVCMRVWDFAWIKDWNTDRHIPLFLNGIYPMSFYVWKVYFVYWF